MWTRVLRLRGEPGNRLRRSLGWLGLGRGLPGVQGLQQAEEAGGLADAAELDAEGLDLDEQVLDVDDLVSDQRLQEDADQPDQTVLEGKTRRQSDTRAGGEGRGGARAGAGLEQGRGASTTCMYLSLICSQVEIQLEMYRWMNSGGRSTAVVNLRRSTCQSVPPAGDSTPPPLETEPPPHWRQLPRWKRLIYS